MQYRMLGPLEVRRHDGRVVPIAGQKERLLLALLLLHSGTVVSADVLEEELWDGSPPPRAQASIQAFVSRLRKALRDAGAADEALQSRKPGYVLEVGAGECDADAFASAVAEARAASDPDRAAQRYRDALALWRGPVLEGIELPPSVAPDVARLEESRLEALEARMAAELSAGRHREVAGELDELVARYPLREELWRSRLLALYRSGRQAEALKAYAELRTMLADELGIDPSPRLTELETAILRQDPGLDWRPAKPSAGAATGSAGGLAVLAAVAARGEFVGRDAQLNRVRLLLRTMAAGGRAIAIVSGEAGIGKTRLAAQVAFEASAEGALVLAGRSDEELRAPYQPFVEALRQFLAVFSPAELRALVGDSRTADLARLAPEIREALPDLPVPTHADSETERFQLFEAVVALLAAAASKQSLVVILDDLQWADQGTLLLLRHVARRPDPPGVLFLATVRDTDVVPGSAVEGLIADLRREQLAERIRLEGLTTNEVMALCAARAVSGDAPSASFADRLRRETEGNPFFIEEVLRHLADNPSDGSDPLTIGGIGIPDVVAEVISRRIAVLSPDAAEVLMVAAVIGQEFDIDVCEQLVDVPPARVLDALEDAVRAGLIVERADVFGRYAFAHALTREALYGRMGIVRRVRLHKRIGDVLERSLGFDESRAAELAMHFARGADAGGAQKAVDYAARAGYFALQQLAYEEAVQHFRHGLEVIEQTGTIGLRARCLLTLGLGGAQWRAGDVLPARETFLEAARLARQIGDPIPLGWAALGYGTGLGGYARSFRVDEQLVALLEEALEANGPAESDLRARLLARLAVELYYSPDIERRRALSNEAVEMADRIGDPSLLLVTLYCREWSLLGPDVSIESRLQSTAQIAALAEELGEREVAYQMQFLRQMVLVESGDFAEADRAIEAAERLAQELRMPSFLPWVLSYRAMRAMLAGRFTDADELVQQAILQALAQHADPLITSMILGGQAMAQQLFRSGFAGILPVLKQMADDNPQHPVMRCSLAWLYRELRMAKEAGEIVREMAAADFTGLARDANWLMSIWTLSEAASYVRDLEAAEKLYALLLPFADRWIVASVSICFGPAGTPLGALATVLGRFDEAEEHFARALAETAALPAPALHAQAARDHAAMLIERNAPGDRERAVELLESVIATTERYGMPSLELTAQELLANVQQTSV